MGYEAGVALMTSADIDKGCPLHGNYHDVFLSYRREDGEDLACHIADALRARNVDVFWDQHCLGAGPYAPRLSRFDQRAEVFLALITPRYAGHSEQSASDFCVLELETALAQRKPIVPIMKVATQDLCLKSLRALAPSDARRRLLEMNVRFIQNATFAEDLDRLVSWIRAASSDLKGRVRDQRCFVNSYPDFQDLEPQEQRDFSLRIQSRVDREIRLLAAQLSAKAGRDLEASEPAFNQPDFSLYTGSAGLALSLFTAGEYLKRTEGGAEASACLASADVALRYALTLVDLDDGSSGPAFYSGSAGVHAIAAIMRGDSDRSVAIAHTEKVLSLLGAALASPETELLYGRAGYLYSLLVLRRRLSPAHRPAALELALAAVFDDLEARGSELAALLVRDNPDDALAKSPLAFRFGKDVYFGAAHGLAGVLFAMLHLPERCLRASSRERIVGSLDFLLNIQADDGNFPVSRQLPTADLVHWCHGAPGIIPTLCKAYEVFGDDRYLRGAIRAGECVWARGLLRKGLGVCHGIAGSALSQLTLYRATHDSRHRYRALRMCEATWNDLCLETIARTPDPQRYKMGVPNHPDSLMEGRAGLLYAYVSIQRPELSSFPGYDGAA